MEKTIHEKIKSLRDKIYCKVYDENKKNPHEHTSSNMFFTEEIQ